jgi:uncharacterized protein
MNATTLLPPVTNRRPGALSLAARARMLRHRGEPLLIADWDRALMIHYEVPVEALRPFVPFPLDLHEGKAYVSLLAFTMKGMRPFRGGRWAEWLFRPIATHGFLNVRTYVRVGEETGIYFLTEHMGNRLSLHLGRPAYGLPYRFARLDYRHDWLTGEIEGRVTDPKSGAVYSYRALVDEDPNAYRPAAAGSLTEWLMERYTAFTSHGTRRRLFRVWHSPWPESPAAVKVRDDSLLRETWPWFAHARLIGANFSPGFRDVWMGRPHRVH